jgi:amino acid transporter
METRSMPLWNRFYRQLIGRPLGTAQSAHERLSKRVALAVFSSDALSSTAYATEEILTVLAVAAVAGGSPFFYVLPISLAIVVLLWLITFSYRQTIHAYPSGGGAYIVAKENLGMYPGLTAAAALLVDYTLTVAVSISSGVAAVTSAVQGTPFAWVSGHRVVLCLAAIALITLANLRGIRESGAIFSVPTYLFVVSLLVTIGWGLVRHFLSGTVVPSSGEEMKLAEGYVPQSLSLFLLLGAFSNGCTALTGVEAISNGVPAFRNPEARNAATTLIWMSALLTVLFVGTSSLAYLYGVRPRVEETVISQFARAIHTGPMAWAYYVVQAATAGILLVAANTSFADFPRLASLMARDRFLPTQFAHLGDRLVFNSGIMTLAVFAAVLVVGFRGDTSRLIPLYAVGVFLSFTLSQAGMVVHWWHLRDRKPSPPSPEPMEEQPSIDVTPPASTPITAAKANRGWRRSIAINGLGACATALVVGIFVMTKFVHGAWIVVILIPVLVSLFRAIHGHYQHVEQQLEEMPIRPIGDCRANTVIVPVTRIHPGLAAGLAYAKCLSEDVHAVYVEIDPTRTQRLREDWSKLGSNVRLEVVPSPYRSWVGVMLKYINAVDEQRGDDVVTVIVPEFVPANWWQEILHNQAILRLKAALLYRPGIVVTSVPFVLR